MPYFCSFPGIIFLIILSNKQLKDSVESEILLRTSLIEFAKNPVPLRYQINISPTHTIIDPEQQRPLRMASISASRVPASSATADTSSTHPYTCNTCQVAFRNSELQRGHMRSDWHRYNLKRRVTSLPPISSEVRKSG